MKKLFVLSLMLFMLVTVNNSQDVEAAQIDPDWKCDEVFDPLYAMELTVIFGAFATDVIIQIPFNETQVNDNGSYIFDWTFYDDTGGTVDYFQSADVFGYIFITGGFYHLNLELLNIDPDAVSLLVSVPQAAFTAACPVGLIDYYNENSSIDISDEGTPAGAFRFEFVEAPFGLPDFYQSTDYLISTKHFVPDDVTFLTISNSTQSPSSTLNIFRYTSGGLNTLGLEEPSQVYFYNDLDVLIGTEDFGDNIGTQPSIYDDRYIRIDLTELSYYDDIATFNMRMAMKAIRPSDMFQTNRDTYYVFDDAIVSVEWVVDNVVIDTDTTIIGGVVVRHATPDAPEGFEFKRWIFSNGEVLTDRKAVITSDRVVSDSIKIYAVFEVINTDLVTDVTDPDANEANGFAVAMTFLGFTDPIERTLVFGFVAVLSAILLLWKGVSGFPILLVVGFELMFFMYLGLLPLIVSAIIIITLVMLILFRGGGSNE